MNNDNMARLSEDEMEMAVAAYLAPLVEGERVFWALAARGGLGYLKRTAREVLTRAPENEPVGWWIGRWPASPSADAVDALLARSGSSQRVALLLSDPEGLPGLREACAARFSQLRVLGLGALRAVGLAELGVAPAGVAFDDSLAALRSPEALLLIAGDDLSTLERYVVVALPARPGSEGERAAPGPEASLDSIHEREVSRLEQKLRQLARRRREAEAELERRGALLRDWALRVSTSVVEGSPHAYASRAAAAEAQREEARFAADELRLALRAARADARAAALTQAAFDGRVRGLRARLAELEEMREAAEAKLALSHEDLREQAREKLGVQRALGEAQEALELAIVREHGAPSNSISDALQADTERLAERLASLEEQRDHARAEGLRLLALVGSLEHAAAGMRRGHVQRVAELSADARDQQQACSARHAAELSELSGEIAGLRARYESHPATPPPSSGAAEAEAQGARIEELLDQADLLRAEVAELRVVRHDLTLRAADLSSASESHASRAADLASSMAARSALVERLQLDLVEEEQRSRRREEARQRAEAECARLRDAVVHAAEEAAHPAEASRVEELERAEVELERALREARHELDSERTLAQAARVSAEEAAARAAQAEGRAGTARQRGDALSQELERTRARADASRAALQETRGQLKRLSDMEGAEGARGSEITAVGSSAPSELDETLMRSLTAQLEERNDRIRGLEARLSVADDSSRLALEETVAQLRADLAKERASRASAAATGDEATRTELERLRQTLRDRYADMLRARSEVEGVEAQVSALRGAVAEARAGLEGLLGDATATGDTTTADRVGVLLRLLGRF